MPAWLIIVVLNLVLKLGMAFLLKRFPWIPIEIKDILQSLIDGIKQDPTKKTVLVQEAKDKIKAHYEGKTQ